MIKKKCLFVHLVAIMWLAVSQLVVSDIVVTIDDYRHQFEGGGCQSTMYSTHMTSMSAAEQEQAFDYLFSDLNMGYLRRDRYVNEGLARNPNLRLDAYLYIPSSLEVNGDLNIADPDVYNKLGEYWFSSLESDYLAGHRTIAIARLLNEPDWEDSNINPGALGYPGNPQKGFALIVDRAVGRLVDMLNNPAINTNGVPRPLFMFPNTLSPDTTVPYLTELKKSAYPRGWRLIDIIGFHQYRSGDSLSHLNAIAAAAEGRRMIVSEMYPNRGDSLGDLPISDTTRSVLSLSRLMTRAVNAGVDSWWYWQTHYPSGPLGLLEIPWDGPPNRNKWYWAFKQLTSLQPRHSYIVGQTVSGLGSVDVLAMRRQDSSSVTVNVANYEGSVKTARLILQTAGGNVIPYGYYYYLTDEQNNFAASGPYAADGDGAVTVQLQPYSLTSIRVLLACYEPLPFPIGHWKLDDGSGTTAADSSGNDFHAMLGAGEAWASGILGGALLYPSDGSQTTAQIGIRPASQLTFSAWFNDEATGADQYFGRGLNGDSNEWRIYRYGGYGHIQIDTPGDSSSSWYTGVTPSDNQWHHLVVTFDVPALTVRLYLDGVLRASRVLNESTGGFMVPKTLNQVDWGAGVHGLMDDVRVYDEVLTLQEVQNLYAMGVPIAADPWPADGVADVSQNAVLSWMPGEGFDSTIDIHKVYIGSSQASMILAGTVSEPFFDPDLDWSTPYFWRVDEVMGGTTYSGLVWTFSTTGERICDPPLIADTNNDCVVDMTDLAQMAADWLMCTHLSGSCN